MTREEVSPSLARHIVQRMGETGQPPQRGALAANVATQPMLDVLRAEYLVPMRETGRNSSFKLVQAPFGGGKTHFLHCLREIAWQEGFATSLVGVSPQECPFDDTVAIYRKVVQELELPPGGPEEDPQPGIDAVLRFVIEDKVERHGIEAVRRWIREELSRARIDSTAVRRAAERFALAVVDGDHEVEALMAAFLRGEAVTASELASYQVRELLEKQQAFRFLRSVAQLLRALDVPGVVLLFDEMDRVMSLSPRRKKAIGDNLRQMLDHCGQSTLPAVLWVYAVPPEFMTTIVPEYPALEQRLKGASTFSTTSPLNPIIDLDRLPVSMVELFRQIGERLRELSELAYGFRFDATIQRENISRLAAEMAESQLEVGARRTYVKAAVQLLEAQRRGGQKRLSDADIHTLANQVAATAVEDMEGEEEFS